MIRPIVDQLIIIGSFVLAFLVRMMLGHFPSEPPTIFIKGYIWMILALCLFYFFLFWLLGFYEKRKPKAVLEEILGVFGVITMGAVILLTVMYMRKDLWVSRGIIVGFWVLATAGISLFHVLLDKNIGGYGKISADDKILKGKDMPLVSKSMKVGLIVVNKDSREDLEELLASLSDSRPKAQIKTVIIDNLSNDSSQEYLKGLKNINVILNVQNIGYGKAVNQGIKALPDQDYYLILNPDIKIIPGSIETALNLMERDLRIGIVGCKLLNLDGSIQLSTRRFYSLRTILYRFTPLRGLLAKSAVEREFLMSDWDHQTDREVDWVLGGCMLIRREAVESVGLMDENIFMYFDDVDICHRMWDKGWKVYYAAEAPMVHKHGRKSANNLFSREAREHIRSLFIYLWKYMFKLIPNNCPSSQ